MKVVQFNMSVRLYFNIISKDQKENEEPKDIYSYQILGNNDYPIELFKKLGEKGYQTPENSDNDTISWYDDKTFKKLPISEIILNPIPLPELLTIIDKDALLQASLYYKNKTHDSITVDLTSEVPIHIQFYNEINIDTKYICCAYTLLQELYNKGFLKLCRYVEIGDGIYPEYDLKDNYAYYITYY